MPAEGRKCVLFKAVPRMEGFVKKVALRDGRGTELLLWGRRENVRFSFDHVPSEMRCLLESRVGMDWLMSLSSQSKI